MRKVARSDTFLRVFVLLTATFCAVSAQPQNAYRGKPYQGRAQMIPRRVEMEFYDAGGQGAAYDDTDAVNNGSGKLNKGNTAVERFRQDEAVDLSYTKTKIDTTVDGAQEKVGDLYLGWTAAGEWA